jgi:hypothetical protein
VSLALALASLLASTGCLIWPFPTGEIIAGRGRVQPSYAELLTLGQSTREDALVRLGEPDEVQGGGAVFLYRWTEVRGYFIVGGYGSAAAIPFPGHRSLRLEFDEDGRLARKAWEKPKPGASGPAGEAH